MHRTPSVEFISVKMVVYFYVPYLIVLSDMPKKCSLCIYISYIYIISHSNRFEKMQRSDNVVEQIKAVRYGLLHILQLDIKFTPTMKRNLALFN